MRVTPRMVAAAAVAAATSCTTSPRPAPALARQSVSATGCVLEEVAVVPGEDHFSFRGVSPDGRWLAVGFSGGADSSRGLYLLDVATHERRPLPGLNNSGSFSPDGRFLVSSTNIGGRNYEIIEYELATGRTERIAPDSTADFLPSYSPDGRRIVFNSYRTGGSDLYLYERGTRALTRLTSFAGYDAHAQFTPDGGRVIFHRAVTRSNYDLVELDLRTREERPLTTGAGEESYPALAPSGDRLVYTADRPDRPGVGDLRLRALADSISTPLTADGGADGYAAWSPDGRYLYFTSRRSGRMGVYRMPMGKFGCIGTGA